ncbi:winged helix-turn-helix domain-containing protein [uncultured Aquimarina sp.]|uniref:winged helix-turn-helix domain-containing protein n=1 Tax=uncultured Aquimarina sp. TaxID=575652 RepID=UPI002617BEFF|nr:winged helix-turn-helix domain-containing protein [uncultured Aquimarina sp.]
MKNKFKILITAIILLMSIMTIHSFSPKEDLFYAEKIKVALRAVGNKLLLKNNDSTSLVLPIKEISDYKFELSFQQELTINPEDLVAIIDAELKKTDLPDNYITEVIHCETKEVSYSYEILGPVKEIEISCLGRKLPVSCYTIQVIMFKEETTSLYGEMGNMYTFSLLVLLIIIITSTTLFKKKHRENNPIVSSNQIVLGTLIFYPDQQKLNKDQTEISLTAKESELLAIFAHYPNQIVKREQLIKQVWEDNGVVVGRSLDMFISKLRKKLGKDSEVKIVNVHGVGYRLEIANNNKL